ncbi:IS4 family transposase, partial [Kamptonema formosum]
KIQPPRHHLNRRKLNPVRLTVVRAVEENPPQGETPVSWLLLTTVPVSSFDDAVRCLRWYSYRWLIERYHYTLKSGCGLEKLQLETARRLEMALATYSIVAWRLLWLTYEARKNPDTPCDTVLSAHEWQSLYATIHRTPNPPSTPPSLREAVRMIAQLGGFLGRKGDGEPGVKTIWRGLCRLHDIASTWQLRDSGHPKEVMDFQMGYT